MAPEGCEIVRNRRRPEADESRSLDFVVAERDCAPGLNERRP